MAAMTIKGKTIKSVDVDWNELYYTNCLLVSASNVDRELGAVINSLLTAHISMVTAPSLFYWSGRGKPYLISILSLIDDAP